MPHSAYIGPDGEVWPSVTEVIDVIAKPGLYAFYAKHGMEGAEKIKVESGDIGSQFHDGVHARFLGLPAPQMSQQAQDMVGSFWDSFVIPYKVTPVLLETKVVNTAKRYHGTFDGIVNVHDLPLEIKWGKPSKETYTGPVLADWKSSNGIYSSHGVQLGGYYKAEPQYTDVGLIVQVNRESLKMKHRFFFGLGHYGDVFYNARALWDYERMKGEWAR